jgi:hydrogenase maturation protease
LAMNRHIGEPTASTIADWQKDMKQLLKSASSDNQVALIGVGHPLRGDDHVGSRIVKNLMKHLEDQLPDGVYLFDAEGDVEAVIGKLTDVALRHVIFIDACEMKMKPGETQLLPIAETSYPFFTTHGIPLKVLAERLLPMSKAWVLAIQPRHIDFGEELSTEVSEASVSVSRFLMEILAEELAVVD